MKNIKTKWLIIAIIIIIVGLLMWSKTLQDSDPDIIARDGFHWHPELVIYVKGEKQEISENIGIGVVHQPMHTHEDLPLIHLEFQGLVRKDDIILGRFFKIWGKDMRSFGTDIKMTVNGEENTDYENYVMRDGDKIELRYE